MYGTQKAVVEATGLPSRDVRKYVKYPRLAPELKKLVDDGTVDINTALKAQDATTVQDDGEPDPDTAIKFAISMAEMSGVQQKKIIEERKKNPSKPVDDVIEDAKSRTRVIQVVATLTQSTHAALQRFTKNEKILQEEAAATLIEHALTSEGLLD